MTDRNIVLERSVLAVLLDGRTSTAADTFFEHCQHPLVFSDTKHQMLYFALTKATPTVNSVSVAESASRIPHSDACDWLKRYTEWAKSDQWSSLGPNEFRAYRRLYEQWTGSESTSVLDAIGSFPWLADLASEYVSAQGFRANCQSLVRYWDIRFTAYQLKRLQSDLAKADAVERLGDIKEQLTTVAGHAPESEEQTMDLGSVVEHLTDTESTEHDEGSWGDDQLDNVAPLRRNNLYILAARPGCGKTSRAIQFIRATAAKSGFAPGRVAVASLEVDRTQFATWITAQELGVSYQVVDNREWDGGQRAQAKRAAQQWSRSIIVNDGMCKSVEAIARWARKHQRAHPEFHTLVVDHIHLMDGPGEEYSRISHITRNLKMLSKELDICMVALCQLNREGADKPPSLHKLRGSGSLEQDAGTVVFLHRKDTEGPLQAAQIIVAKNRYGMTKTFDRTFRAAYGGEFVRGTPDGPDPYGISQRMGGAWQLPPSDDEDLFG